jgi:hypothetical protein
MPDGWSLTKAQILELAKKQYPDFDPLRVLHRTTGLWTEVWGLDSKAGVFKTVIVRH